MDLFLLNNILNSSDAYAYDRIRYLWALQRIRSYQDLSKKNDDSSKLDEEPHPYRRIYPLGLTIEITDSDSDEEPTPYRRIDFLTVEIKEDDKSTVNTQASIEKKALNKGLKCAEDSNEEPAPHRRILDPPIIEISDSDEESTPYERLHPSNLVTVILTEGDENDGPVDANMSKDFFKKRLNYQREARYAQAQSQSNAETEDDASHSSCTTSASTSQAEEQNDGSQKTEVEKKENYINPPGHEIQQNVQFTSDSISLRTPEQPYNINVGEDGQNTNKNKQLNTGKHILPAIIPELTSARRKSQVSNNIAKSTSKPCLSLLYSSCIDNRSNTISIQHPSSEASLSPASSEEFSLFIDDRPNSRGTDGLSSVTRLHSQSQLQDSTSRDSELILKRILKSPKNFPLTSSTKAISPSNATSPTNGPYPCTTKAISPTNNINNASVPSTKVISNIASVPSTAKKTRIMISSSEENSQHFQKHPKYNEVRLQEDPLPEGPFPQGPLNLTLGQPDDRRSQPFTTERGFKNVTNTFAPSDIQYKCLNYEIPKSTMSMVHKIFNSQLNVEYLIYLKNTLNFLNINLKVPNVPQEYVYTCQNWSYAIISYITQFIFNDYRSPILQKYTQDLLECDLEKFRPLIENFLKDKPHTAASITIFLERIKHLSSSSDKGQVYPILPQAKQPQSMARLGRRISVDGVPTVANTRRISVDDVPNVSNITAVKKPPKRQPQKISRRRQTIHELHNSAECHSIGQIHVPNQNQIPNANNTKYLGWPNQNSINSDSRLGHLSYPNRNETVIANKGNTGRSWQNQNQISNGMTNNIGHNDNMNAKSTGYMPWPSQKQIPQSPNQISGVTFQGYRPVHYQHKNQIINNRSLNMGQVPNSHPPTTLHNQNYPSRNPVYGLNHQRGPQLHPYNFSASQDGLPFPPPYVPPISISNQRIPQYHQNPMINSVNGQYERSFQRSTVPNDIIQINNNQAASATNMQVLNNISIDNPIINNVNGQYERTATGFKRGTVLTDTVNMKNNQPTSANIQVFHNISVQDPHINSVNGQYQRSFQRHTVPTDTNNLKKYQTASAKNMPVLHNISVQDPVINNVNDLHESFQRGTVPNDITRIKNNQITSATNMQVLHNISVQDPHINSVNGQYQRSFQRHTVPTDTNNLKKYQTAGAKNMPVLHNISVQDPVINNLNGLHERSFHRGTVPNDITHIKNNKTTSATNMQVLHNISVQDPHINSVNGQYQRSFQRHTVPTDTNNIKNYQTASDKNMPVLHNIFVQDPVINNVNDLQERSFQRGTIPNDISHIKNNQTTSATNMQVLHNISVQDPVINSVNGQYQRSFQSGTVPTDIINIKNNRTASAGDNIFQANESSNSADARKVKDFESTATDDSRTKLIPNAGIGASDQDTKNGLIGNHLPIDTTTTNRNDSKTSNSIVDRMLISDQSMEVTVTELTKNSTDDLHESADVKNVEISKEPPKKKLRLGGAFYDFRELVRTTSDTKTYGKILKKFVSEQKPILLVNVEDGTTEIPETNESDDTEKIGSILHDSVDSDIIVIDDDSDVLEVIGKARGKALNITTEDKIADKTHHVNSNDEVTYGKIRSDNILSITKLESDNNVTLTKIPIDNHVSISKISTDATKLAEMSVSVGSATPVAITKIPTDIICSHPVNTPVTQVQTIGSKRITNVKDLRLKLPTPNRKESDAEYTSISKDTQSNEVCLLEKPLECSLPMGYEYMPVERLFRKNKVNLVGVSKPEEFYSTSYKNQVYTPSETLLREENIFKEKASLGNKAYFCEIQVMDLESPNPYNSGGFSGYTSSGSDSPSVVKNSIGLVSPSASTPRIRSGYASSESNSPSVVKKSIDLLSPLASTPRINSTENWKTWITQEKNQDLLKQLYFVKNQSVETISNAGSDYSPPISHSENDSFLKIDNTWYRVKQDVVQCIPKGKLSYDRERNWLRRYFDDKQLEQFLENADINSAIASDYLKHVRNREGAFLTENIYLTPFEFPENNEIIELPREITFSSEEMVITPEMYVEEMEKVRKVVPREFHDFYGYVAGYQIVKHHSPISFLTFLTMHNTGRTKRFFEKFLKLRLGLD